jgi:hypothetical protein
MAFSPTRATLALLCLPFSASAQDARNLCRSGESVLFSCTLQRANQMVSLCAAPDAPPYSSVTYRFGTHAHVRLTHTATAANDSHFSATVSPASPRASVQQVWFMDRGVRYIVTACNGGDCNYRGGLIVLKNQRSLLTRACRKDTPGDQPWFSRKALPFSSAKNISTTDLIRAEDFDNRVELLYPVRPR